MLTPEEKQETIEARKRRDYLASLCTHDKIIYDQYNMNVYCPVCGTRFKPIEPCEVSEIGKSVDFIIRVIESIKLFDNDEEEFSSLNELYEIVPIIKKIPYIWYNNFNNTSYGSSVMDYFSKFNEIMFAENLKEKKNDKKDE